MGDSKIVPSTEAIRNLGCWFDNNFTMDAHVTKTCKAGFFYLHNICRIRKFLTQEITEKLIHAFVTSRVSCDLQLEMILQSLELRPLHYT